MNMNHNSSSKQAGTLLLSFAILINIPYGLLSQMFEYDDILRQPADYILTRFNAGGAVLIFTWLAFALCALLFIPASAMLHRVLMRHDTPYLPIITGVGITSAVLQAIGLLRWVFVVPVLARLYVDPTASDAVRAAATVAFQTIHQYGGVAIGEHLGQVLLIAWTAGVCAAMRRSPIKLWVTGLGLATLPLWALGQSELIATVIPSFPVVETAPIGFMLWEVWLLVLGVSLLLGIKRSA